MKCLSTQLQKQMRSETRRLHMTQLPFTSARCVLLITVTVHQFQPHSGLGVDSALSKALPTPMALGFPSEGLPRRQPGQEKQVMLEGKGAPGLPCPRQQLRKQC